MRPRLLLPSLCGTCVCESVCTLVREISLYQFVSQCCQSSYSWKKNTGLISGTDHPALLVLLIQLSWLNYLPGQETQRTHTEKRSGPVQGSSHSVRCRSSGTQHKLRLAYCAGWPIKPMRNDRGATGENKEESDGTWQARLLLKSQTGESVMNLPLRKHIVYTLMNPEPNSFVFFLDSELLCSYGRLQCLFLWHFDSICAL